jgi:hypothetical protein
MVQIAQILWYEEHVTRGEFLKAGLVQESSIQADRSVFLDNTFRFKILDRRKLISDVPICWSHSNIGRQSWEI